LDTDKLKGLLEYKKFSNTTNYFGIKQIKIDKKTFNPKKEI